MKLKLVVMGVWLCTIAPVLAQVPDGPRVEVFSPQGTVKGIRQVSARFSDPMVPFGDPRGMIDPFDINCPEKGVARWADVRNWIIDFERDLPAGVRCEFALKLALKTLAGKELAGQRNYAFSTGGTAIKSSTPREGSRSIDEEQIFILTVDGQTTEESIAANVYFSIEGINDRVGVRLVSEKDRTRILKTQRQQKPTDLVVLLQAKQRFPAGARVKLVWGKGVMSNSGVQFEEDQVLHFETRKPFTATFSCQRENERAGCLPISGMQLGFSAPVLWDDASRVALKGQNGTTWTASRDDYEKEQKAVSHVIFRAPFPESASFLIELPSGFKDDAGRKLSNADKFPLAVRTDAYPPLAKFPAPFGILELNADPILPVSVRNIEAEVKTKVLRVGGEKEKGLMEKATALLEKLKGKVLKVESKKGADVRSWLNAVFEADGRYGDDRAISIFASAEKIGRPKEFAVSKPNGAKAFEVVGIPLKEPGLYVVEIESPILGASMLENRRSMFVAAAALVTNLSVHFKWGRESSLAWVTTLDKAQPVKDAFVTAQDCAGNTLWQGKTDDKGIARLGHLPERTTLPNCGNDRLGYGLMITAETSNDLSFVHSDWSKGIEPWRFQLPDASYRGPVIAHSILDRSLFRAGDMVHMKHILRQPAMNGFATVPDQGRPKAVAIQHQGTWQVYEFPLTWDPNGVAETTWSIPREAKLGVYDVILLKKSSGVPGPGAAQEESHEASYSVRYEGWPTGQFRVEEFRVPLMKALIQPPAKPLVAASETSIDLSVQYLAGGAAGNLPVRLRSQVQPKTLSPFEGFEDYTFANGLVKQGILRRPESDHGEYQEGDEGPVEAPKADLPIQTTDLTLNLAGSARTTISNLPKAERPMEVLTELEFRDPNGEVQTVSSRIPLWPAERLVGIRPDSWAVSKEALKFYVAVVSLAGEPVVGAVVEVDLLERKMYSHRKRLVGGFYAYEHVQEVKRVGPMCQGKTDGKGLLVCEAKSSVSGNVILQATTTDGAGNKSVANRDVWVAGKADWWFEIEDHDRMDVLPVRTRYEPGETAKFQVRMPFREATALVTVEREGVMETFVKTLSGKEPIVEVPVVGHYAPNVFVSVLAVRGRVGGVQPTALVDLGRPAYKLGVAEIHVGWKAHELKVKVSSDRQVYRVRDNAKVRIAVKSADGKTPPPGSEIAVAAVDEGLLELMPNASWQLLDVMMGRRGYEVHTATAQMQVVGKRHFGLKAQPQGGGGGRRPTRELFDTLLLWKARIPLNEKGEASLDIPLNDSITGFRIVAVATGGMAYFGTGSTSIRSTQDLMILSGVAPVVREGDRIRSEFTVRNASDRIMEVVLTGRLEGVAQPLKPIEVSLSPGEAKEQGWDLTVPIGVERLSYEVGAREKGGVSDRTKVVQMVIPAVPVRTFQATITQVDKEFRLSVKRPGDAIPGRGSVNILLRPTLADALVGITEYMKGYPYTCLEQKISQAVALGDEGRWKEVMAALPAYLDSDGLAKFFPQMERGSDVLTSYLLAIAHEVGWEIPLEPREKMESALKKFVGGALYGSSPLPTADLSIRKVAAIEAMSRSGQADPQMLTSFAIEPNLWPTSAVIDWFNILQRVHGMPKRGERMKEAEQILRSRLNFQGSTMGFSTEQSDTCWWLMVSNDGNAVRLILSTLNLPAWKEDLPRLVRGAIGRQKRGAWDLTVANAWGTLAVKKFAQVFESTPVSGRSTATLSSRSQDLDWRILPKGEARHFEWPEERVELSVSHMGTGKPWLTVQSQAAIPLKEPLSSGYKIKRIVTPVKQIQPGVWSRGDVARIRLEIDAQADMTWVVVSDPIPGGGTILGGGLGRDSQIATKGEEKKGWVRPAFEERSSQAFRAYYEYVPKGSFTTEYTVRLNQSGEYQLSPTRVEAMYSPEMFGELPNEKMEVELR